MDEKIRLSNIYIKIHNHRSITYDDLEYLSKYDPECFEKTCCNVVYNEPETKEILRPEVQDQEKTFNPIDEKRQQSMKIDAILANLRSLETNDIIVKDISAERMKELLGELYMEKIFPHSDKVTYLEIAMEELEGSFNKVI